MENKSIVFFIDVDNTLLNNDKIKKQIQKSLEKTLGRKEARDFWQTHDEFREDKKLVNFPQIIRNYCQRNHSQTCDLTLAQIFNNIDFKSALYPHSLDSIKKLKKIGKVIIFTEGDEVYQKNKVEQSGLAEAVDQVMLYARKLDHLDLIRISHGQAKLVFLDDKSRNLIDIRRKMPQAFLIEVCQGHHAKEDHQMHSDFDKVIDNLYELTQMNQLDFFSKR